MPEISVIMPLYNAQKYLEESLNSILNQTFKDFELICINDASEDDTLTLLQKYESEDGRIRILENEERSGAALSRNKGIKEAKGEYLIFLDGDDIFEEEMLEASYKAAKEKNVDILMFNYKHVPSSQIHNKVKIVHGDNFVQKYCKEPFSVAGRKPYEFLLWSTSPCNKLFHRQFVIDNGLLFQNLSCSNDIYFVNMALLLSDRTLFLNDDRVMIYARDHREPSRISNHRDPMCCYKVYTFLLEELLKLGKMDVLYQHYFYEAFFSFKYALEQTKDSTQAQAFYEFLQNEGICKLRELSRKYESQTDGYINYIFNHYKRSNYETRWFEKETILKVYIKEEKDKFISLFANTDVVIWGAGENGKTILQVCKELNLKIRYIVDSDEKKQGEYIEGYCIMKPESVIYEADRIIISALGIAEEVKEFVQMHDMKIEITDVNDYMIIS